MERYEIYFPWVEEGDLDELTKPMRDAFAPTLRSSPGHEIPRTETEPKNTENRTEGIRFFFGSQFSRTERTELNSILGIGLPNSWTGN
jgi:hypothetical protein